MQIRSMCKTVAAKALVALLAVALVFTMMPLNRGFQAHATTGDLTIKTPVLVVTGQGLIGNDGDYSASNVSKEKSYTLDELKALDGVTGQLYSGKKSKSPWTKSYFMVDGVKISSLLDNLATFDEPISVVADDGYAASFTKDAEYVNDNATAGKPGLDGGRYYYEDFDAAKKTEVPAVLSWAYASTDGSDQQPPTSLPTATQEKSKLRLFVGQFDAESGGPEDMNQQLFNGNDSHGVNRLVEGDAIDEVVLTVGSKTYTRAQILMMDFAERTYEYDSNKGHQVDNVRGVPFSVLLAGEDDDAEVSFTAADGYDMSSATKTVADLVDGNYMLAYELNGAGIYKTDKNDASKYGFLTLYGDGAKPASMINSVSVTTGGIDFSKSPYKHITNGGITGQDGPFNIDAITGATLTIEGPGMTSSTALSVRDLETKNAGAYRGVYSDTRNSTKVNRMYEGIDVYYLLQNLEANALTDKAYKVAFKNRNRQTTATLTLADIKAMHDAGQPALVAYGTAYENGDSPSPWVFNGGTGEDTTLGNNDGCLKLVYDLDTYGDQDGNYATFGNMAYIYVEEEETPGFKHDKDPYKSAENSQYVLTVTGDEIGAEINYTVDQLENMVQYDENGTVDTSNGYGYRDEYCLANSSYWYVNTYEGVKLWSLLCHSGIDAAKATAEGTKDTPVTFRSTDNYTGFDTFTLEEVADPDKFGFYEKNANDNNDGTYVPNENIRQGDDITTGDKLRAGFPILVAYGTNYYPYVKDKSLDGYLSGLSNDGGPLRVISGKRNYNHANGSNQAKLLDKIVVGGNTYNYSTHYYNDESTTNGAAYKALADNELTVTINDGSGKENSKTYTVGDIEQLIYGGSLTKTELGEAKIKEFYETEKNGQFYSDLYEGLNLNFFLTEVIKLAGSQGTITFKGADGTLEKSLEDVLATTNGYNGTTELGGLSPVIAYAKNGYPMVTAKNVDGWVKTQTLKNLDGTDDTVGSYTVQNQGGPLQLVFPRADADATSTMGTMTGFTEIEIDLEADKYAHIESPYDTYADNTITVSGEGTRIDGTKSFTVAELEGNQSLATTKTYSLKGQSGDPTQLRYRGLDLYRFLASTNVGLKNNADTIKIYADDSTEPAAEFTRSELSAKYKNTVTEDADLPIILAYGSAAYDNEDVKDGLPLVAAKTDEGYVAKYGNDGGPLKLVIGQTDADDANKSKCIKNVTKIEVTASEQTSWNHNSQEVFKQYLNDTVEFVAVDTDNNVLGSKTYTVAELEEMTDIISQEDIYAVQSNTWEGINFWQLIQRTFSTVSGIDSPITINVLAKDGFSADAVEKVGLDGLRNGVKDGENYVPVLLAYAVDGYPLVYGGKGAGSQTGEGYDSNIDNKGGPMRLMVHQAQGACLMEVVRVTVKVGAGETPTEKPAFTVASNTLDNPQEFSIDDLKALTPTVKEYDVKGVTEKVRGVLMSDLLASMNITDTDATFKIEAGGYDGAGTYSDISLADATAQKYLVAYEEYLDDEWKDIDDTTKTPNSKVRIYRNYMEAHSEADQAKWFNKCQYLTGITVSVPEKVEFDYYKGTGQEGALPLAGVRSVQEDKDGNLWVATYGGGMAYKAKDSDQFVRFNYESDPAILATTMTAAYPDANGGVWFNQSGSYSDTSTNHGVAYMDKDGAITYYTTADDPQTVPHNYSYCLNIDKQGNVWIGTTAGLTKYDPAANTWQSWTEGFPAKSVQCIEFDNNGGVWLGFYPDTEVDNKQYPYYGGFAYFKDGEITNYNIESDKQEDIGLYRLQDVWIRDIAVDKNGGAWIVGSGIRTGIGMNCIGGKVWYVSQPGADPVEYTGYGLFGEDAFSPNSELRKVAFDPDGGLWFGTSGDGVFRVDDPTVSADGKLTLTAQYSRSTGSWTGESGSDNIWSLDFFGNTLYAGSATGVAAHEFEFQGEPEPPATGDIGDKTADDCDIAFTGDALARSAYYSIKGIKNNEDGIEKLEGVSFHTKNSSGTEEDFVVDGVTLESIVNVLGLAEGAEIDSVEIISSDGYKTTYTPEQAFSEDLQGNKAMFIWKEGTEKPQKVVRGQFSADDQNKGAWARDVVKVIFHKKEVTPPASADIGDKTAEDCDIAFTGDALARSAYYSIKGIKNNEDGIEKLEGVSFHTLNMSNVEEDFVVDGVTLESVVNVLGLAEGAEIGSVEIVSADERTTTYTPEQAFSEDLQGNKAMFIWKEGTEKPQKVVRGQFSATDYNKGAWAKDAVKVIFHKKEVTPPAIETIGDATAETADIAFEGDAVAKYGYYSIRGIKNNEDGITKLEGVSFHTKNSSGTEEDFVVDGVTLESIVNALGLVEGAEIGSVEIISSDGYKTTYTPEQAFSEDLQGNKAMFIWKEGTEKPQKVVRGQFSADDRNKGAWAKDAVKIIFHKKAESTPVTEEVEVIENLPAADAITFDNAEEILAAIEGFEALTAEEQASVPADVKAKLEAAGEALIDACEEKAEETIDAIDYSDYSATNSMGLWLNLQRLENKLGKTASPAEAVELCNKVSESIANVPTEAEEAKAALDDYPTEITANAGTQAITVSWDRNPKAESYEVYRATAEDGEFVKIKATANESFIDTTAEIEQPYFYMVKARAKVGGQFVYGEDSNIANAKIALGKAVISKVAPGKKMATVTWKQVKGADGYVVYRSTKKSSGFKAAKTITSGSTVKYANKKLTSKKTYYFKVRAYKTVDGEKVFSGYSAVKSAKIK